MINYKSPDELYNEVIKYVVGQDKAAKELSVFIFNYFLYHYSKYSNHIIENNPLSLLMGESGSGKTFLVKTIAKLLNFKLIEINSKGISQEGWHGTSFKELVLNEFNLLPKEANNSINKILFIDEIDKFCIPQASTNSNDHSPHMQSSLLKYLEGFKITDKKFNIDLTNCCIILAGNFQSIRDTRIENSQSIGFINKSKIKKDRIIQELETFGMIPEFIGRISNIIELDEISEETYNHLINNENFYFQKYKKLLNNLNIEIPFTSGMLSAIINKSKDLKIGVRGFIQELNKLISKALVENQTNLNLMVEYLNYLEDTETKHNEWKNKIIGRKI